MDKFPTVKIEATPRLAHRWARALEALANAEQPNREDFAELYKVAEQIYDDPAYRRFKQVGPLP